MPAAARRAGTTTTRVSTATTRRLSRRARSGAAATPRGAMATTATMPTCRIRRSPMRACRSTTGSTRVRPTPAPTYQERAVSGWSGYGPTAYGTTNYSYSGGPYSNATTHYYDGMPAAGGYSYRTYSNLPATYSEPTEEEAPAPAPVYRRYHA